MMGRQPVASDLVLLAQALAAFGVEYALIEGTAQTSREADIPDRLKLERLRNALRVQAATAEVKPK